MTLESFTASVEAWWAWLIRPGIVIAQNLRFLLFGLNVPKVRKRAVVRDSRDSIHLSGVAPARMACCCTTVRDAMFIGTRSNDVELELHVYSTPFITNSRATAIRWHNSS